MKDADGSIYYRGVSMAHVTRDQRWVGRNSFYVEHGDWFVAACAWLAAAGLRLLSVLKIPARPRLKRRPDERKEDRPCRRLFGEAHGPPRHPGGPRAGARGLGADIAWEWVATRDIADAGARPRGIFRRVGRPGQPLREHGRAHSGPYAGRARAGRPFLGTCGGFQHALLEFARDVAGIADADTAETNPGGRTLVVTPLSCSLVEKSGRPLRAGKPPRLRLRERGARPRATGATTASTRPTGPPLEAAGLRFTAWDDAGEVRGAELGLPPVLCGVLFQPERAALRGDVPPLVLAFVKAVAAARPLVPVGLRRGREGRRSRRPRRRSRWP
jgi:hypothetical protein